MRRRWANLGGLSAQEAHAQLFDGETLAPSEELEGLRLERLDSAHVGGSWAAPHVGDLEHTLKLRGVGGYSGLRHEELRAMIDETAPSELRPPFDLGGARDATLTEA